MGRGMQTASLTEATVIALADLRRNTAGYDWFQFKPGVKKLLLSGTPDSRHVSVLWYDDAAEPGAVPLHHHHKTESIFVIDGAQSDPKGRYEAGSFYFNPPGSAHHVFESAGLFLLSYAAPPDFSAPPASGPYDHVVVGADYERLAFSPGPDRSLSHPLPVCGGGGMTSRFVKPHAEGVVLTANVLLLLRGSCDIAGEALAADTLLVTRRTDPAAYAVTSPSHDCLLFELAFA